MANEERINSAIGINALRFSAENVTLDCLGISSGVQFHSLRKMSLTALRSEDPPDTRNIIRHKPKV